MKKVCAVCLKDTIGRGKAMVCQDCKNELLSKNLAHCAICGVRPLSEFNMRYDKDMPRARCRRCVAVVNAKVIAPRYHKAPRPQGHKMTSCSVCPFHETCKKLNYYDLPVMCEEIWHSDVEHIERMSGIILKETGFIDRVQMWDDGIWQRYREAI